MISKLPRLRLVGVHDGQWGIRLQGRRGQVDKRHRAAERCVPAIIVVVVAVSGAHGAVGGGTGMWGRW